MTVTSSTKLKELREELKLSQEKLANLAGITQVTYRSAEIGSRKVQYSTAMKILDAINNQRQANQLPPVSLADLGLTLE